MVEFGLKLEDNKVSEWADKYIDYERLKEILKKAQAAIKKKDEMMQRQPELAAVIAKAFVAGSKVFVSPPLSQASMGISTSSIIEGIAFHDSVSVADTRSASDEKAAFLEHRDVLGSYGSESSFQQLISSVTGIFSKTQFEANIRTRLQEVVDYHTQFEDALLTEVRGLFLIKNICLSSTKYHVCLTNLSPVGQSQSVL